MFRRIVPSLLLCWIVALASQFNAGVVRSSEQSLEGQTAEALELWRLGEAFTA